MTPPYEVNVTRWEYDYPGWYLDAGFEGVGWRARPKHQRNGWLSAMTLDDLAALIDAQPELSN